jgi:methyl-accepting chemotaxis protein
MTLEDNNTKITTQISSFKEGFTQQLLSLDDILDNIINIYSRMDLNFDLTKNIQEASDDILDISEKYKSFSDDSMGYISQINDTNVKVSQYLEEIEYYSNKANILSLNTSIKSFEYGEIGKLFEYFNKEFKDITAKFSTNITNIKEIITSNMQLGKSFHSIYDTMNYPLLVKKINQISSFVKSIDKNTKEQFKKLSILNTGIDSIYDKNKLAIESTKSMQNNVDFSNNMLGKLVSFLNH